ncbi:MAG: RHS repeat protein, partial [Bacteroides sp.]|nr:RHS repeat protein [Bacteroides sp.]
MKKLHVIIIIVATFICMGNGSVNAQTHPDSIPQDVPAQDSIPGVRLLSAVGEDIESLFNGVIPCSPQAASLARYAEYPVSLTTGIPDITIPLYEIRMGDFSLPISISYHASGARPDEVPSCVGLGWTLNAGGAITRTILGGPDLEVEDVQKGDYSYYRMSRIDSLVEDVKKNEGRGHLRELTDPLHYRDSESDRYCFNAGGHVGIFRYSYKDRKYICLDRSQCRVESSGYRENSYFRMYCPDNTTYWFTVHEKTGPDPEQSRPHFTTAWYVSRIDTPYGSVNFKYREMDDKFYVRHTSTYFRSGYYPRYEPPGRENVSTHYYEFDIDSYDISDTNTYYWQKLITSIEWNGNTVEFEYAEGNADDLNMRLSRMTVKSRDGGTVKTVVFGNEVPWKSGTDKGRRVLSGLDDSVEGSYGFKYYTGNRLPNVIQFGTTERYTDSWGYYNGGEGAVLSKEVADWLRFTSDGKFQAVHTNWRDRSPKLEYTRLGVLKTIVFPTGGEITYDYELNERYGERHGGLRVASTTLRDGSVRSTKKYSYIDGVLPQMHPDSLSMHLSYLRVFNDFNQANTITLQYRTAHSSPIYSAFCKSAPVIYTKVKEELSDGTYTIYEYDAFENGIEAFRQDWHHPSSYPEALTDWGMNEPVLKEKRRYSASGTLLYREANTYAHKEISSFETGIRLISVIDYYTYKGGTMGYEEHKDEFPEGVGKEELLIRQTTARQMVTALESSVTEDFTTGFSKTVRYTHDPQYRTLRPLTETVTNSDGTDHVRRYKYPFHRTGEYYRAMVDYGYSDWVLSTSEYSGGSLISRKETEYEDPDYPEFGWALPLAWRSWSAPTSSSLQSPTASLPDRAEIGTYTIMGRPASITVNGTDLTTFTWAGDLLESMTAPGGLKTTYTQRPLIGVTSMTQPNGYQTKYTYNDAGMLTSVADGNGPVEAYSYSIASHPSADMTGAGNSVTTTRFLNVIGPRMVKSRQYHDGLGRSTAVAQGGVNTKGTYVYTAVSYDALGRESQTVLPSVGGSEMSDISVNSARTLSTSTYSDRYAWSETSYDALDRPVKVTTPGEAWHSAGKGKTTEYISNAAKSVRLYRAPMERISLVEDGYYAAGTLQGMRSIDEDGNEMTVYTDRLGRKVLERRGPESQKGQNDTYFVHNALGQLRYVLSPGYERAGYKDEYAYEYRYDEHGNVVKKFIPGAGYTQYWYDRAGRLAFMQDPNLREEGLHRFFVYDRAGRLALQGVSASCSRGEA